MIDIKESLPAGEDFLETHHIFAMSSMGGSTEFKLSLPRDIPKTQVREIAEKVAGEIFPEWMSLYRFLEPDRQKMINL